MRWFAPRSFHRVGGAEGIRTPDPHNAIVVLYQLSYDPNPKWRRISGARGALSKLFAGRLGICGECARGSGHPVLRGGVVTAGWMQSGEAQDFTAGFRDHRLVPGRVPDDFDAGCFDAGEVEELLLRIARDGRTHTATGGGEGHFDKDLIATGGQGLDAEVVNETEVHNVDGDFGVVTGAEDVPEMFFLQRAGRRVGDWGCRGGGGEPEGVGVFGGDAVEAAGRVDGVGAAEGLGDVHRGASGQGGGGAGGNLDYFAVAGQFDGGDVCHGAEDNGGRGIGNRCSG